jgi:beta-lactamase regulating signal transducer with metallopeptidase domain
MITNTYIHVLNQFSALLLPVLLRTLIKSIILFAIVALLIRAFNVKSVRTKYVLWVCYVFSVILIAIYTVTSPTFGIPFLQISPHRVKENKILSFLLFPKYEALSIANNNTIESCTFLRQEMNLSSESLHWSIWGVYGWITGFIFCLLYALTGRIGVRFISRSVSSHGSAYITADIHSLARDLGIERDVNIVVSSRCRLPFTYKLIHPVLVIPYEMKNWPESKLRSVLIHELAHIRRNDYLLLLFSRFICFIFWFIPVVWIAHSKLQLEQENLCDLVAVQKGERPTVYARHMIELARTTRHLILWSGIFITRGRNKLLEERVTNVLSMKRLSLRSGDSAIKIGTLTVILIFALTVLALAGNHATGKKAVSIEEASEIRSGIRINEHHKIDKMFVQYPDGRYECYRDLQQESLVYYGISEIYESWRDSEGLLWYRAHYKDNVGREGYELVRISNSDNTFEIIMTQNNQMIEEWKYPVVGYCYSFYYRQE